jgi:hypothetical protein
MNKFLLLLACKILTFVSIFLFLFLVCLSTFVLFSRVFFGSSLCFEI